MELATLMKENDIALENLFTLTKYDGKEGLMFFNPIQEEDEEGNIISTNLDPVCIFVDGAKFIYNSDMDKKITINCVENVITMTRIDGIQLNIDTKIIEGFPFNYEQFSDKFIKVVQDIPQDHVKVEN